MRTMPRAENEPHLLEVLHVESQRDVVFCVEMLGQQRNITRYCGQLIQLSM